MKTILCNVISICVTFAAYAQLSIQPVLPFAGVIQKASLWNVTVINTSPRNYECRLELTLRNRASGFEVLTASSGYFAIPQGVKQLNAAQIFPIQYNYGSAPARNDDFIPIGNYLACYRLVTLEKNLRADDCAAFDAEPLSPPMLIQPIDSSVTTLQPAQFSWIPPAPFSLFTDLLYDVTITEILDGQKAEEAVQNNLPFYFESGILENLLPYTNTASLFEKNKWYAWQVTARDNESYSAKSDVWVFSVSEDSIITLPVEDIFILMDGSVKGAVAIANENIRLKYFSFHGSMETKVIFRDDAGEIIRSIVTVTKPGENYLSFPLGKEFKSTHRYSITIEDKNSRRVQTLTFSIK